MNNLSSQLNPGTDAIFRAFRAGLDASPFGSAATAVLRFEGIGQGDEGNGFEYTVDGVNGSRLAITRSGLYVVSLRLQHAGATGVAAGVSMNTDAAGLVAIPSYAVQGMQDVQLSNDAGASGAAAPLSVDAFVAVRAEDVQAGIDAGEGGAVIRAHARTLGDTEPSLVGGTASLFACRLSPIF